MAEEPTKKAQGSVFSNVGATIPAASAMLLGVSVLYDWSYLNAIGLDLSAIPTSVADHVRSAVVWLPGFLATMLLANYFSMHWEIPSGPSGYTPKNKVDRNDLILLCIGFCFLGGVALFFKANFALIGASIFLLIGIIRFEFGFKRFKSLGWSNSTINLIRIGFCLLFLICWNGASQGYFDASSEKSYISVEWQSNGNMSTRIATNIRSFGQSTLLVGPNNTILIIPTGSISRISYNLAEDKSLLCSWFEISCIKHHF